MGIDCTYVAGGGCAPVYRGKRTRFQRVAITANIKQITEETESNGSITMKEALRGIERGRGNAIIRIYRIREAGKRERDEGGKGRGKEMKEKHS